MNRMKKYQNGQTLIEAVAALGVLLIIIAAIATVMITGLYNAQFIKNQNEAGKLAQEGMELVRSIQKNNLDQFKSFIDSAVAYCIDPQTMSLYSVSPYHVTCNETQANIGNFNRTITFMKGDPICDKKDTDTGQFSQLRVTVKVKWSSSKCSSTNTMCHESKLVSCMPFRFPESNP